MSAPARSLYLHIPYCQAKCPYCDFNSIAGRDEEQAAYVQALLCELRRLPSGPYETVFMGGGTPTHLRPDLLASLLRSISAHIALAPHYEWTCEANPGSADDERLEILAAHGVNRISIGVQSLSAHHLHTLGRVHDAAAAERTLASARRLFPRVNADLIIALPEQTDEELHHDLALYARHQLDHAAVYHLTIEPGTVFHGLHARGEIPLPDGERSVDLLESVRALLATQGLHAYETSNFARPGSACRHNLAYWEGDDWQAVGAGAVSSLGGLRALRHKHPAHYIAAIQAGGDAVANLEDPSPIERQRETWMLGLRLEAGLRLERLEAVGDRPSRWQAEAERQIAYGMLENVDGRLRLTTQGRPLQDHLTARLMP